MQQEAIKRLWRQALNMAGVNAFMMPTGNISFETMEKYREYIWEGLPNAFAELKMHGNFNDSQKEYLEKLFL